MHSTLLTLTLSASLVSAIWPVPTKYSHGDSVLWIKPNIKIEYQGPSSTSAFPKIDGHGKRDSDSVSTDIVKIAVDDFRETLFKKNIVPWKFRPRRADFEPSLPPNTHINAIILRQTQPSHPNISHPLSSQVPEWYTLQMPYKPTDTTKTDHRVTITSPSALGLSHALKTLTQLFYTHSGTKCHVYTPYAPIEITDEPKFAHRGLNLDVARSFYAVEDIERTIDALSYNKFNRLHLHITDGQSWPLEIKSLPELSKKGSYCDQCVYRENHLEGLLKYGELRGVEVGLEIDMPGHTSSIYHSHPDLITAYDQQPDWANYSLEPPSGGLKLSSPDVTSFLTKLFDSLLPRLSPFSSYFHAGGDEVNFNTYELDNTVRSSDPAVIKPLLQKFFDHVYSEIVEKQGMRMVLWEETLSEYNLTLPRDVVVQSWKSDESVRKIVESGHQAIAGNYQSWYLDCGFGAWTDYAPGEESRAGYPYSDYCTPNHNWRTMYAYDPLASIPRDLSRLVLGGEASLWSEQTDGMSIDTVIWPRLAAAGEVLWSGAKDPQTGQNRSQITAAPRLGEMRERLVARGVRAAGLQMPYCTMHEDGTELCGSGSA